MDNKYWNTLSVKEKESFLYDHFCYEVEMLVWSYLFYDTTPMGINLKLEIFLTHARVLHDFLCRTESTRDSKIEWNAKYHYFIDWNNPNVFKRNDEDKTLKDFWHRCSLTLSHVWRERSTPGIKYSIHDISIIFKEIKRWIIRFLEQLPEEYNTTKEATRNFLSEIK